MGRDSWERTIQIGAGQVGLARLLLARGVTSVTLVTIRNRVENGTREVTFGICNYLSRVCNPRCRWVKVLQTRVVTLVTFVTFLSNI